MCKWIPLPQPTGSLHPRLIRLTWSLFLTATPEHGMTPPLIIFSKDPHPNVYSETAQTAVHLSQKPDLITHLKNPLPRRTYVVLDRSRQFTPPFCRYYSSFGPWLPT